MNKIRWLDYWRSIIQAMSLLAFLLLIYTLTYPLAWRGPALQWFSRLDPWFLINQIRWQNNLPVWAWLPLLTLLTTILWGRVFCSWLCPLGTLLTWTDKLGRTLPKKLRNYKKPVGDALRPLRYYWLLLVAVVFLLGSNWVLFLTPFTLFSHELVRILQGSIPWVLMGIIVATLFLSRIWCSVICPTGMLLSLTARWRFFRYITKTECTRCKKCLDSCPVGAAPAAEGGAREWCLVCGDCRSDCPSRSIEWQWCGWKEKVQTVPAVTGQKSSRRGFILLASTVLVATVIWRKASAAWGTVLRPPGARPEQEFNTLCSRCGQCIKVCPNQALWPMTALSGFANLETPELIPRRGRCDLCMACQEICPTGAILSVPVEKVRIGKARLDEQRCLAWNQNKLCLLCAEQCPFQAFEIDDMHRPSVIYDRCVGCGSCENGCPVEGEAAIRVFPQ